MDACTGVAIIVSHLSQHPSILWALLLDRLAEQRIELIERHTLQLRPRRLLQPTRDVLEPLHLARVLDVEHLQRARIGRGAGKKAKQELETWMVLEEGGVTH